MNRLHQVVLIGSTIAGSWLGMQAVHESGHVLGAWVTGGRVARVVLHPLTISRTDLEENPSPLRVVWAGPVVGILIPALLWAASAACGMAAAFVLRFFAGFSLVANGLYIGLGSFGPVGDCAELLRHGAEPWQLWLFGAITTPVGLWLWHGQGRHFGLGTTARRVNPAVAYASLAACVALLCLGLAVG